MTAYYNEFDAYAAQWLRNLIAAGHIAPGDVDERSIKEVSADDLREYTQCHFFAGIGGWSLALRLAGWPDSRDAWSGSCPCQPLSSAGQHKGHADERHLWPTFYGLITERQAPVVFGEQVASADGIEWLAAVRADLESQGYAVGAADLPALAVGSPQERQRIFFVADATGQRRDAGQDEGREFSKGSRRRERREIVHRTSASSRIFFAPRGGFFEVVDGLPERMAQLRAYGNAIDPEVAAEFIAAFAECRP